MGGLRLCPIDECKKNFAGGGGMPPSPPAENQNTRPVLNKVKDLRRAGAAKAEVVPSSIRREPAAIG